MDDAVAEADGSGDGGLTMADATGNPDGVSNSATSGLRMNESSSAYSKSTAAVPHTSQW